MSASRRAVLLVVDDDLDRLLGAQEALASAADCEVLVAQHPQGALCLLERTRVDVLVCDLDLVNEQGEDDGDLLELVRARWPSIARIVVTGPDTSLYAPGRFAAAAVLVRPSNLDHLVTLLEFLPAFLAKSAHAYGAELELRT